jgi:hypothetical protein
MAKSPLGKTHKYQADPLAGPATKQAPQASAGATKASKTSGKFGGTSEGKVQGKGPNKPR